jgi:prevent-host-death family protein
MEIAISEFKAKCIQLLKEAATSDQELVVTLRGNPLARVVGVQAPAKQRKLGGQRAALSQPAADSDLLRSDLENDWKP